MNQFEIAERKIGNGLRPFIIAEVGQAHDGSLGLAHCFIEAAAKAGVDAIKFQTHIAKAESTLDELFRVKFSLQDRTRFDYWQRMEFTAEQWDGLARHAKDKRLVFLSSPFSIEAVELLDKIGVPAWKIGSGEFWSDGLLNAIKETEKPLLISTGMSDWAEIEAMASELTEAKYPFGLLQCTSLYPVSLEDVGLNVFDEIRNTFFCPTGLSDHSGTIFPSVAAMARNAALIEVHITLSREMFGPDVSSSLTTDELRLLVDCRDAFWTMDQNPVDKNGMAEKLNDMRNLFTKSIALKKGLCAGHVLQRSDLCLKKPGTGIPIKDIDKVVGRVLLREIGVNRLLKWDDLNET
jgi:N,N'-diacetyllegionaminate synthase